ncbi:MAG: tRNA pseudouridine(55) synthase TruB [Dehalococcoidia bacterium]|nr:tRNA pseudouridine(55) synthase TruB [Dehalococcoidia bacterium]
MSEQPWGILIIDKPGGLTSHDVVARLRRLLGIRRIGHGGTLDPLATGVLPVCIGSATRVAGFFTRWPKTYRCTMRMGISTDTYDAAGAVVREDDASAITAADIERALEAFRGEIAQTPPAYSAVKLAGRPLYDYARKGQPGEVSPRSVHISSLHLTGYRTPEADLTIECGSGTYVRALVHDLGTALGCGAHVTALRRTAVGPFTVERALTLEALAAEVERSAWQQHLLPADTVLASLPRVLLTEAEAGRVLHGGAIERPAPPSDDHALARAYDASERFLAILRYDTGAAIWSPWKVFNPGNLSA